MEFLLRVTLRFRDGEFFHRVLYLSNALKRQDLAVSADCQVLPVGCDEPDRVLDYTLTTESSSP